MKYNPLGFYQLYRWRCVYPKDSFSIISAVMILVCMDCNLDQRLTVLFDVPRLVAPPSARCTLHSRLASLIRFAVFVF